MNIPKGDTVAATRTVETTTLPEGEVKTTERDTLTVKPPKDGDGNGNWNWNEGPNKLTHPQLVILHQLTTLHSSLTGPQTMLETAGNFNRPPFPSSDRSRR